MSDTAYIDASGDTVDTGNLEWLEDEVKLVEMGEGEERVECSRYWVGGEDSVWLDQDMQEVIEIY